jgi:hypothetical protein
MASAELAAVESTVLVELCNHFMCSCKRGFGSDEPDRIHVEKPVISEHSMTTPLILENDNHSEQLELNGVITPRALVEAFNECDGRPVILGSGKIVCGALDAVIRKRKYGREEI